PAASADSGSGNELAALAAQLEFGPADSYLSLVATLDSPIDVATLQSVVSDASPRFVGQLTGTEYLAVLGFASSAMLEPTRAALINQLAEFATRTAGFRACVGNGSRDIRGVSQCLAAARDT